MASNHLMTIDIGEAPGVVARPSAPSSKPSASP
jgi:hypothetical protein